LKRLFLDYVIGPKIESPIWNKISNNHLDISQLKPSLRLLGIIFRYEASTSIHIRNAYKHLSTGEIGQVSKIIVSTHLLSGSSVDIPPL